MPLEREAEALRQAAGRNDFNAAAIAARRYVGALEDWLPALDVEQRKAQLGEGMRLIEWARRMLRAAQTRLAGELARLNARAGYRAASTPTVHTWKLHG